MELTWVYVQHTYRTASVMQMARWIGKRPTIKRRIELELLLIRNEITVRWRSDWSRIFLVTVSYLTNQLVASLASGSLSSTDGKYDWSLSWALGSRLTSFILPPAEGSVLLAFGWLIGGNELDLVRYWRGVTPVDVFRLPSDRFHRPLCFFCAKQTCSGFVNC